ncbi:MAG: hypothetical protein O7F08_02250, partial [Deltaproteobacteria bacterium]|nr:hypothetical protein [Deltaproteobacteria bacterium]
MRSRVAACMGVFTVALVWVTPAALAQQTGADIPRTSDGRPDLSGIYDTATLTPLQRPERYGNTLFLTEEEAAAIEEREPQAIAEAFDIPTERNDTTAVPDEAPPVGGDGSSGAAGNVGGYNTFWMDRGTAAFQIDGRFRTSIIVDPPDGRRPPLTPSAQ